MGLGAKVGAVVQCETRTLPTNTGLYKSLDAAGMSLGEHGIRHLVFSYVAATVCLEVYLHTDSRVRNGPDPQIPLCVQSSFPKGAKYSL